MKKIILLLIALVILLPESLPQTGIEKVLTEIEKNNPTLAAIRKQTDSEKIGNRTGIFPDDPEVEFNYLLGSPSVTGNRKDLRVIQSFDFPTAYIHKSQISKERNAQVELEYIKGLKEVLHQARLVCVELVYSNALNSALRRRLTHAGSIEFSYKRKFESGETDILDYNRARLNLLNASKECAAAEVERRSLLSELELLNGGIPVELVDTLIIASLPENFEEWYRDAEISNPDLQWLRMETELSRKQEKLNSSLLLPGFLAGYMSEKVPGSQYQGITMGISIPLWEDRNSVKYARAQTMASESIEADNNRQFLSRLKALHSKAVDQVKIIRDYKSGLELYDNSLLLGKALEKGEISLPEYFIQISEIYSGTNRLLEIERALNITLAEMNRYK